MTIEELNKLYIKRVISTNIDFILFVILLLLFGEFTRGFLKHIDILYNVLFTFVISLLIYYYLIPLITKGQTIGNIITKTKMVYLSDITFLDKLKTFIFRFLFSFFTLYGFRMLSGPKMNNLGQLYFDERFKTSIVDINFDIKNKKVETYNYVVFPITLFIKFFVFLFLLVMLTDLII